jgi:hypothetical protein
MPRATSPAGNDVNYCQKGGFRVFTAVATNSSICRDTSPWSTLKVNQCFGGTFRLHLQIRIVRQARNQHEEGNKIPPNVG